MFRNESSSSGRRLFVQVWYELNYTIPVTTTVFGAKKYKK